MDAALDELLQQAIANTEAIDQGKPEARKDQLLSALERIDQLITAQVDAIREHPAFRQLEAAWRGLALLARRTPSGKALRMAVLPVTAVELERDFARGARHSALAERIASCSDPLGMLIVDYEFHHEPSSLTVLRSLAEVCAQNTLPLLAAASPRMFGLTSFSALRTTRGMERLFTQPEYAGWRDFRASPSSRFVGLVMPRIYLAEGVQGNAAYALAACATRAQAEEGWPLRMVGQYGYGYVDELPGPLAPLLTSQDEAFLAASGLVALVGVRSGQNAALFSTASSCHDPPKFSPRAMAERAESEPNSLVVAICAARLACGLRVLLREPQALLPSSEIADRCQRWLNGYTVANEDASAMMKARYPLRAAAVKVEAQPARPGYYRVQIRLALHGLMSHQPDSFQIEFLVGGAR